MEFLKVFDGECTDGSEIRMYEGNGDNDGSVEERVSRCSAACRAKKKPLTGSWDDFVANGFIITPSNGRCYCESSDAFTCERKSNEYDRYVWKTIGVRKVPLIQNSPNNILLRSSLCESER